MRFQYSLLVSNNSLLSIVALLLMSSGLVMIIFTYIQELLIEHNDYNSFTFYYVLGSLLIMSCIFICIVLCISNICNYRCRYKRRKSTNLDNTEDGINLIERKTDIEANYTNVENNETVDRNNNITETYSEKNNVDTNENVQGKEDILDNKKK